MHNAPESRQSCCCLVTQSCLTLCASMDYSLPGSSIHGILQARILEWVAISFSKRSPDPGIESGSPGLTGRFFTEPPGKPRSTVQFSLVAQSCLTLCDPMDCSLLGSSVHGIFQARVLEWVTFPSPEDLPDPGIEPRSPSV